MRPASGAHRILARELARPIDRQGTGAVVLAPGPPAGAVEHIIGREMDQRNSAPRRPARDGARSLAIDPKSDILLALGPIDSRIGGRGDDKIGRDWAERGRELPG